MCSTLGAVYEEMRFRFDQFNKLHKSQRFGKTNGNGFQ